VIVMNSGMANAIRFLAIDDRRDPDRAEVGRQILGSPPRAMTLTRLQSLARPAPVQ
jgi:hypothetical protein